MTIIPHWNYYIALEEDVIGIARYVELSQQNFSTYSTEIARILMGIVQELDVILKQLCNLHGDTSSAEQGYRTFLSAKYPSWITLSIEMPVYGLSFLPYASWSTDQTAQWWTANNKVKHHRHTHFCRASVGNMLEAMAALFVANVYFHSEQSLFDEVIQGARLCYSDALVESISPTIFGTVANYKIN